jgi:hypothetical protein
MDWQVSNRSALIKKEKVKKLIAMHRCMPLCKSLK